MKNKVITICNRKGGVGKTITADSLAAGLSLKGYNVLCMDLDSQGNLTYQLKAKPNNKIMDILQDSQNIEEAIIKTEECYLIPASPFLAQADLILQNQADKLKNALKPIKEKYDYIIIDTAAALGSLFINALTSSDFAIVTAEASILSLQGIYTLMESINSVKRLTNPDLLLLGILLTRFNPRTILAKDMLENIKDLTQKINTRVFKTPIRECNAIKEAQYMQQNIFTYAPRSNAAKDYQEFITEFLELMKE